MKIITTFLLLLAAMFFTSSCASKKPYYKTDSGLTSTFPTEDIDYEIYLVGDIGVESNSLGAMELISKLKETMRQNTANQSVVFLGNFVSKSGLNDEETPEYDRTKKTIQICLDAVREKTNNIHFIPGNNEWFDGRQHTIDNLQATEDFLEELAGDIDIFQPSQGCGEPVVLELSHDLVLVLTDSQWMVQSDDSKERQKSGCEIDNNLEYISYMHGLIAENRRKNIVIASHHPLYSNGKVGGDYPVSSHLLPLPVIGSLITGVKKIMGKPQQFGHPDYEAYRAAYLTGIQNCEGCITVSGHENSMQHFENDKNHFVVSGSASAVEYVRQGDGAEFSSMSQGFAKIVHTKDLELWLEFYGMNQETRNLEIIYRKLLHKKEHVEPEEIAAYQPKDQFPVTRKVVGSAFYAKNKFLRGKFYRTAWAQPIDVPLVWLDEIHGGLKPIQQGGGFQTKSLRLENPDGVQYVVRSVDKDLSKFVPPALRNTFAQNLVQDAIGAAHPYGAIIIPKLAEAAGIYHSNPSIVYLPEQEALGQYNTEFAEGLYIMEERPGGNVSKHPSYGNTEETVNTLKLVELLAKNHKHKVDQEWVLRSRLFDLWIGDWDRHDDQWRWAIFDKGDYKLYRPIPRDRDQAFYKNNGVLDYIASRPYFNTDLRIFDEEIDYLPGLMSSGKNFDRSFLHQLKREDFIQMAKDLQARFTDAVIDDALSDWPKEIQDLNAAEIKRKLIARRAKLQESAIDFYEFLFEEVAVSATNSKDIFDIEYLENDHLRITVYYKEKDDRHLIFENVLDGNVTKEVRMYGLKKEDHFNIRGNHKSTIKVRIVGGSGSDEVDNTSSVRNILVYDRPGGMTVSGDYKSRIKDKKGVNSYHRTDRQIDRFIHFPIPSFYIDEGIGLNYNIWWKKFGFRKDPYKSNHTLAFSYFPFTNAFVGRYNGHHPDAIGDLDFELDINAFGPTFTQYFYGLGNAYENFETTFPEIEEASSPRFHIVKGTHIDINPSLTADIGGSSTLKFKPIFEYFQIKDTDDDPRYYLLPESNIQGKDFDAAYYAGFGLAYNVGRIDNIGLPSRGFNFNVSADFKQNLSDSDFSHLRLGSELQMYIPFNQSNSVVLSMNIGGAYNFGDTKFFHANYLSNKSRLRGFKTNRFGGEGIVYHATDLRFRLIRGKGSFPISMGIFGSFDYGRAWYDKALVEDDSFHTSYGGGIFLTPLDILGFRIGYFVGEDDTQISLGGVLSF